MYYAGWSVYQKEVDLTDACKSTENVCYFLGYGGR